jgi:hypothetical protein
MELPSHLKNDSHAANWRVSSLKIQEIKIKKTKVQERGKTQAKHPSHSALAHKSFLLALADGLSPLTVPRPQHNTMCCWQKLKASWSQVQHMDSIMKHTRAHCGEMNHKRHQNTQHKQGRTLVEKSLSPAHLKYLSLANLGSPATYMPTVMSYPWRICYMRRWYKSYPWRICSMRRG